MELVHVRTKNYRGFFAPFFGRFKNNQAYSRRQRNFCYTQIPCEGINRQPEKSRVALINSATIALIEVFGG